MLYRGGIRGLEPGDLLRPPADTGAESLWDFGGLLTRRDRIYLTDEVEAARYYALLAPPAGEGAIYGVVPVGALEEDPDHVGEGQYFAAPSARVAVVVERQVARWQGLTPFEATALLNRRGELHPTAARFASLNLSEAA